MPYAPKDPKTNAAGCAERKPFSPADFFSTLLGFNKNPVQRIFQINGWQVRKRPICIRLTRRLSLGRK